MKKFLKKQLALLAMIAALVAITFAPVQAQEDTGSETGTIQDTENETDSTTTEGWQGNSYYRNGKAVNGWQEIDGYYYYFKKQVVQKNTIAGTKATGQYYVGRDGIRVDDPVMNRAVQFVLKNSKASDSRSKRLKDCCTALRKYHYFHMSSKAPAASGISDCAEYMLKNHKGNCYRFASSMCYVAIALGYRARVAAGGVTAYRINSCLYKHGWCEIYYGGHWRIWDLSMQRKNTENLLKILYKEYPFHLKRLYRYKNTIAKGKITWRRVDSPWTNTSITYIK